MFISNGCLLIGCLSGQTLIPPLIDSCITLLGRVLVRVIKAFKSAHGYRTLEIFILIKKLKCYVTRKFKLRSADNDVV